MLEISHFCSECHKETAYFPVSSYSDIDPPVIDLGWEYLKGELVCDTCIKSFLTRESFWFRYWSEGATECVRYDRWHFREYVCMVYDCIVIDQAIAVSLALSRIEGKVIECGISLSDYTRQTVELWLNWRDQLPFSGEERERFLSRVHSREDLESLKSYRVISNPFSLDMGFRDLP